MGEIKIFSYNCRGLNDTKKRSDVFNFLKDRKADIFCLQDLHFTENMKKHLYNQWNAECFFSFYKSNARGVGILFKRNLDLKVHQSFVDENGNYIVLDLSVNSKQFTLINVYGPNTDQPKFYENIFRLIDDINNNTFIWCGDFNLVQDIELDYDNYKSINNNKNSRSVLLNYIDQKRLFDPFRELNGNCHKFTWRRTNPIQQARLDFFLITEDLLPHVRGCDIDVSYRSDHSIIILKIDLQNIVHEKGLWKFNNSLLCDLEYLNCIYDKIDDVILQYLLPVYNIDCLKNVNYEDLQFSIDDQLFLETLSMEIRGKTISFSSYKTKKRNSEENSLLSKIQDIETNINEENKKTLSDLHSKLESIRTEKIRGHMIRSRAQWIDEGEKPSKFFCNLEKYNYASKIIPYLQNIDGSFIYDQKSILNETEKFYSNLYSNADVIGGKILMIFLTIQMIYTNYQENNQIV